jgi:hypothetical protein
MLIGTTPGPDEYEYHQKEERVKQIDTILYKFESECAERKAMLKHQEKIRKWQHIPKEEWENKNSENNGKCPSCNGLGKIYVPIQGNYAKGMETPQDEEEIKCSVCNGSGKINAETLRFINKPHFVRMTFQKEWDTEEMQKLRSEREYLVNKMERLKPAYEVYIRIIEVK